MGRLPVPGRRHRDQQPVEARDHVGADDLRAARARRSGAAGAAGGAVTVARLAGRAPGRGRGPARGPAPPAGREDPHPARRRPAGRPGHLRRGGPPPAGRGRVALPPGRQPRPRPDPAAHRRRPAAAPPAGRRVAAALDRRGPRPPGRSSTRCRGCCGTCPTPGPAATRPTSCSSTTTTCSPTSAGRWTGWPQPGLLGCLQSRRLIGVGVLRGDLGLEPRILRQETAQLQPLVGYGELPAHAAQRRLMPPFKQMHKQHREPRVKLKLERPTQVLDLLRQLQPVELRHGVDPLVRHSAQSRGLLQGPTVEIVIVERAHGGGPLSRQG